jgi:hypothetical protein
MNGWLLELHVSKDYLQEEEYLLDYIVASSCCECLLFIFSEGSLSNLGYCTC